MIRDHVIRLITKHLTGERYASVEDLVRWAMILQSNAIEAGDEISAAICGHLVDELSELNTGEVQTE